jgi:hypothetical protein
MVYDMAMSRGLYNMGRHIVIHFHMCCEADVQIANANHVRHGNLQRCVVKGYRIEMTQEAEHR